MITQEGTINMEAFKSDNNKTGWRGVAQIPGCRFQALISKEGTNVALGTFDTPEEAARAFAEAYIENRCAIESAPKKKSKPRKPRKPRDGLCVMCKTYLFDESLGDCYCCGDVCAEEYVVKHKTTDAPAPDVGSSTQGGVKRKRRGEADVPSA